MTIIAAIKENGKVYLGADSMATDSHVPIYDVIKVFKKANYAMGISGTLNIFQFFSRSESLSFNIKSKKDVYKLADVMKNIMTSNGFAMHAWGENQSLIHPFYAIIATKNRIFTIFGDYTVIESRSFACVGSGHDSAIGAYYAIKKLNIGTKEKLKTTISAAKEHNLYCGGKTIIVEL